MTTEPSTSGPTLPWPIDAVVLGEVTWAARTVVLHCDTFEFLRTLNFTTRWDA